VAFTDSPLRRLGLAPTTAGVLRHAKDAKQRRDVANSIRSSADKCFFSTVFGRRMWGEQQSGSLDRRMTDSRSGGGKLLTGKKGALSQLAAAPLGRLRLPFQSNCLPGLHEPARN
jgi:hypothetical protein